MLSWIAVLEEGFYIHWIYTSVTQHWAQPETQLPWGDMDGGNDCVCKHLLAGDKFFPSLSYSRTFDLGKPEESFLTSSLLEQKQDQTSCSDTLSHLLPSCSVAFLLVHSRRAQGTALPATLWLPNASADCYLVSNTCLVQDHVWTIKSAGEVLEHWSRLDKELDFNSFTAHWSQLPYVSSTGDGGCRTIHEDAGG